MPDFRELLEAECAGQLPDFTFDRHDPELFARLDYARELRVKSAALSAFFKDYTAVLHPLAPAPLPRNYRSTTKRRGHFSGGHFEFRMANGKGGASMLEPKGHRKLYEFAAAEFNRPQNRAAAAELNYLILRGDYERFAVILNMRRLSGEIVRKLKAFSEALAKRHPEVFSCFIYLDETGSDYYFERERPDSRKVAMKKLFGPACIALKLDGTKFLYDITAFSQVNLALLPDFTARALELLELKPTTRVLDLYCGYGLFGLLAAKKAQSVVGVDYAGEAIRNAEAGANHLFPGKSIRYSAFPITRENLADKLPEPAADEVILLDPPRGGVLPGVIETLCARRARCVLHIFCGIDVLKKELAIWEHNGYTASAICPFDLFSGTANVETMVLLRRKN